MSDEIEYCQCNHHWERIISECIVGTKEQLRAHHNEAHGHEVFFDDSKLFPVPWPYEGFLYYSIIESSVEGA
jgi:hypothetical protein